MRLRRSLRARVAAGLALLGIVIVGANAVWMYIAAEGLKEQLVNHEVWEELEDMTARDRAGFAFDPPDTHNIVGYIARNDRDRGKLPEHLRALPEGVHKIHLNGNELRVGVRNLNGTHYVLAYDVTDMEARMQRYGRLLGIGVGVTVLLLVSLVYWMSGSLARPVSDLAQRVDALGPAVSGPPLEGNYADIEVRRLARAFDDYVRRIADFIAREQEFAANISHELRTPLTAIQTSCELLDQDPALREESRNRIRIIRRACDRMTQNVRSLLYLARSEAPGDVEETPLRECVDEAVEPLRDELKQLPVKLEISVAPDAALRVDRNALILVLTNFLRNALDNTERGTIAVRYQNHILHVQDTGRGISDAEITHVFERFYRGAASASRGGGLGLGLAIVKRLCDQHGWHLTLNSQVGVGTEVAIQFPA